MAGRTCQRKKRRNVAPEIEARIRAGTAAEEEERRRRAKAEEPTRRAWAAREKEREAEEQARRAAEAERRYAAEEKAKLPANRLYRAYVSYAHIQLCNQERKSYAVTYINDVELQRGRAASKAIENAAAAEDPKIDRDKLFAEADKTARSLSSGSDACQSSLAMLLASSPVSPYQTHRP